MKGFLAPKNPEKKRPYFYIIRNKDLFGSKQKDKSGIQFIAQNGGCLINSAQIVGNIKDKKELKLLESVNGFRKLVHSIGISVETENLQEQVEFVFQMYGKKDIYGGGSNLRIGCRGDSVEARIYLSEVEWSEDDYELGQIKFIFDIPEQMAKASVRLYLNDGFYAPEVIEENSIDFTSSDYKKMIKKSLMSTGNVARLARAIRKAKAGEDVTLAYIGGSITQGSGATPTNTKCYAYKSYCHFNEQFSVADNTHFIKAGVGGTPSELGVIRFDRDVLRDGIQPDVVVIEFAVNDDCDETKGDCFESLVRKVLRLPNKPAVVLLFSVFANDENLQERLAPIGKHYDLPMVSILDAVTPQFQYKKGQGRVLSKNQFFYDMYHPQNSGHMIMADCLANLFDEVNRLAEKLEKGQTDNTDKLLMQKPVIGNAFENVKLLDRVELYAKAEIDCGGFTETDMELQCVEMDKNLTLTPEFPYNWMFDGTKSNQTYFELKIICKALVMIYKDSGEIDVAKAEVVADGKHILIADPHLNNWLRCNPVIVLNEKECKEHLIRIQIVEGDEKKKFTILGFGYVE